MYIVQVNGKALRRFSDAHRAVAERLAVDASWTGKRVALIYQGTEPNSRVTDKEYNIS